MKRVQRIFTLILSLLLFLPLALPALSYTAPYETPATD